MSFPRYPKYKDSGVEWLGEVPEHWQLVSCRGIVHERTDRNEGTACVNYLSLMANVGIIPYAEKGDVGNKKPEDLSKCKLVKKGDFVINSMNYGIGSYGVSGYDGVCSPVYIVMTPQDRIIEARFAFRVFEDRVFQTYAQSFGNGILEHRCAINWDILKPIGVPVPPRDEQQTILCFLDRETAKIDELVAEQRRLIELLKEKRQAVISHAVTQGLNPNVPLKPSGIEWLGDVPDHWEVLSFRHLVTRVVVGIAEAATQAYAEEGVPMVRSTNINSGIVDESDMLFIAPEFAKKLEGKALRSGDIVTTRTGANVGISAVVPNSLDMAQCFTLLISSPKPDVNPHFYAHYINANPGKCYIDLTAWGSSQPNISVPIIQEMPTVFPPLDEQVEIVQHIDRTSGQYRELIAEATRGIELLQERRTALISAAVTGKIDVRSFAERYAI